MELSPWSENADDAEHYKKLMYSNLKKIQEVNLLHIEKPLSKLNLNILENKSNISNAKNEQNSYGRLKSLENLHANGKIDQNGCVREQSLKHRKLKSLLKRRINTQPVYNVEENQECIRKQFEVNPLHKIILDKLAERSTNVKIQEDIGQECCKIESRKRKRRCNIEAYHSNQLTQTFLKKNMILKQYEKAKANKNVSLILPKIEMCTIKSEK